jgi:hypothetical protein
VWSSAAGIPGSGRSSPGGSAFWQQRAAISLRGQPWVDTTSAGLFRCDDGRRILQVCIFHTLEKNLASIDFSVLLSQVMTIADEVDSQLRQAMECYVEESIADSLPA